MRISDWSSDVCSSDLRPGGDTATIPVGFTFPKHVYIVATMNSVDRAAVPIDSALARRFDRIEMRPNLDVLVELWGMDKTAIPTQIGRASSRERVWQYV